jgi:hypothetical protein
LKKSFFSPRASLGKDKSGDFTVARNDYEGAVGLNGEGGLVSVGRLWRPLTSASECRDQGAEKGGIARIPLAPVSGLAAGRKPRCRSAAQRVSLEIITRTNKEGRFKLIRRRWVIERTSPGRSRQSAVAPLNLRYSNGHGCTALFPWHGSRSFELCRFDRCHRPPSEMR